VRQLTTDPRSLDIPVIASGSTGSAQDVPRRPVEAVAFADILPYGRSDIAAARAVGGIGRKTCDGGDGGKAAPHPHLGGAQLASATGATG
jgi:hypothetical protein